MSQRLVNIYTHLVQNRKHELIGWYNSYKKFCEDVDAIRANLSLHNLQDSQTYTGTSIEKSQTPFDEFITQLLYEQSNGISTRGRSVLSWNNLEAFKKANGFDSAISDLIVKHDYSSYDALKKWWAAQKVGNNPVLINRATAACTAEVSTTVDEGKFNQLFDWMQNEDLISPYQGQQGYDWFNKNVFVINQLTAALSNVQGVDKYWISLFVWEMFANISNPFSLKKQIVKYGSPGTGKTYTAIQNTKLLFEIWKDEFAPSSSFDFNEHIEQVQFHPSYTYEDFLEGLRPKPDNNHQSQLILQNGVFKTFSIKAAKWERDIADLVKSGSLSKEWRELRIQDVSSLQEQLTGNHWKYIFNAPDKSKKLSDAVPPYFFIIDEINRAELSRVFGELMYCLEYRGVKGALKTQYSHLNDGSTGMIQIGSDFRFFIPFNIYVIGTMNTIDRSVESFDFALRRRFRWEEVMPDTGLLYYHLVKHNSKWVGLANDLQMLNDDIKNEPLLGRDFQIGHAYLWDLPYSGNLTVGEVREAVWEDSIEPLLQEYLRGTGREDLLERFASKFGI